jgi:hypothetical protein
MSNRKKCKNREFVATTQPIYIDFRSTWAGVNFEDIGGESPIQIQANGWDIAMSMAGGKSITGYFFDSYKWELDGFYNREIQLMPTGGSHQQPAPHRLKTLNGTDTFMKIFEVWTTSPLTEGGFATLPGFFPGFPTGNENYKQNLNPDQVLYGRATYLAPDTRFSTTLGLMTTTHESIIGNGSVCASTDLYYFKVIMFGTSVVDFADGNWFIDIATARDFLLTEEKKPKDDVEWFENAKRSSVAPGLVDNQP